MFEMNRRGIAIEQVEAIIKNPKQELRSLKGRVILQNKFYDSIGKKEMMIRVIGVRESEVFKIITVYKTSRIQKYWKED